MKLRTEPRPETKAPEEPTAERINASLTAVIGFADAMLADPCLAEDVRTEFLKRIREAARRLQRLLQSPLNFQETRGDTE